MQYLPNLLQVTARVANQVLRHFTTGVSTVAFWTGVIAPLLYLGFFIPGVRTKGSFTLFLSLIALNYIALIVGYPCYNSADT